MLLLTADASQRGEPERRRAQPIVEGFILERL
jgi:hypothetical protein